MKRIALLMLQMVIRGKRKFRGVDEGDLSSSNTKPYPKWEEIIICTLYHGNA